MPTQQSALIAEVARLKRELAQVKKGQRIAHGASIENAAVEVRDDTGSLRAIVGQQGDGTTAVNVVNGPLPPTPSAPIVEPTLAALMVAWNGAFKDSVAAPLDWLRCEVHIGATAEFAPGQETLRDTIESPQGGIVTIPLPYTEWYVKLRSRTSSGTASTPTTAVAATPRKAATEDLTAGIITANLIAVDALTGKTITGGTVTGATVQTAATGKRIVLDSDHLAVLDSDSNTIAEISPTDQFGRSSFFAYNTIGVNEFYAALTAGQLRFGLSGVTTSASEEAFVSYVSLGGGQYELVVSSGKTIGMASSEVLLYSESAPSADDTQIDLAASKVYITGDVSVGGRARLASGGGPSNLSLKNSWTNFDATFYGAAQVSLSIEKRATLLGRISGTASNGTLIATLPAGYWPLYRHVFPHRAAQPAVDCSVLVNELGELRIYDISGTVSNVSLSGMSWPIA